MSEGRKTLQRQRNSKTSKETIDLLGPTLHHLSEQGDAVQVDELLGKGDVPGCIGQVLESLQLGIHAGRLDPFMKLDRSLVLEWTEGEEEEDALVSEGTHIVL